MIIFIIFDGNGATKRASISIAATQPPILRFLGTTICDTVGMCSTFDQHVAGKLIKEVKEDTHLTAHSILV